MRYRFVNCIRTKVTFSACKAFAINVAVLWIAIGLVFFFLPVICVRPTEKPNRKISFKV